jgi:sulfur-carrier protein
VNIEIQFFGQLRDVAGSSHVNVELSPGAKVVQLLEKLYQLKPALRDYDKNILVGAGVDLVDRDYSLHEGEEIAIMPPVQGG